MWISLGIAVAGFLLSMYLMSQVDIPDQEGHRLEDLTHGGPSVYGDYMPVVFGNGIVGAKIFWSDIKIEHMEVEKHGGDSFLLFKTPTQKITTYTYTCSFAALLHDGEITGIRKLWFNNTLVYDFSEEAGLEASLVSSLLPVTIYYGTEAQTADPTMAAQVGAGNCPAYKGVAYLVAKDLPLAPYGNSHPNIKAEIVTAEGTPAYWIVPVDVKGSVDLAAYSSECGASLQRDRCVPWQPQIAVTGDGEVLLYNLSRGAADAQFLIYNRTITDKIMDDFRLQNISYPAESGWTVERFRRDYPTEYALGIDTREKIQDYLFGRNPYWAKSLGVFRTSGEAEVQNNNPARLMAIDKEFEGVHWWGSVDTKTYTSDSIQKEEWKCLNRFPCSDDHWTGRKVPTTLIGVDYDPDYFEYSYGVVVDTADFGPAPSNWRRVYGDLVNYLHDRQNATLIVDGWNQKGNNSGEICQRTQSSAIGRLPAFDPTGGKVIVFGMITWPDHFVDSDHRPCIQINAYIDLNGSPAVWREELVDYYVPKPFYPPGDARVLCAGPPSARPVTFGRIYLNALVDPDDSETTYSVQPDYIDIYDGKLLIMENHAEFTTGGILYVLDGTNALLPLIEVIDLTDNPMFSAANHRARFKGFCVLSSGNLAVVFRDPGGVITGVTPGAYDYVVIVFDGISNTLFEYVSLKTDKISVQGIVESLLDKAGVDPAMVNMSALSGIETYGLVLTENRTPIKMALNALMQSYLFDVVSADWQLTGILRGGASVANIPLDEMGCVEEGRRSVVPLVVDIKKENELPAELTFKFLNIGADYNTGAVAAWKTTKSRQEKSITVPVVMDLDEAVKVVETWMQTLWRQKESYKFSVPAKYFKLLPGDIVTADNNRMMIESMDFLSPGILEIQAAADGADTYVSTAVHDGVSQSGQTLITDLRVRLLILDIPSVSRVFSVPVVYVVGYASGGAFPGAQLFCSQDGVDWEAKATVGADKGAVYGLVTDAPGEGPVPVWDRGNTMRVKIRSHGDSLSSASRIECINGANTAAVVSGAQTEILSFQNVTDLGGGEYELSMLLRGRYGTETAIDKHASGGHFVLIDTSKFVTIRVTELQKVLHWRTVPSVSQLQEMPRFIQIISAKAIWPWSPCHPVVEYIYNSDETIDVLFSWTPRSRDASELWSESRGDIPNPEVPLLFDFVLYEMVWDEVSGEYIPAPVLAERVEDAEYIMSEELQTQRFGKALYLTYYDNDPLYLMFEVKQVSQTLGHGGFSLTHDFYAPPTPLWSPVEITTLAWFDSFQGVDVVDGKVAEWRDQSGNKHHVSEDDPALRPEYITTGSDPTLRFVRTDGTRLRNLNTEVFTDGTTEYNAFVFFRDYAYTAPRVLCITSSAEPGRNFFLVRVSNEHRAYCSNVSLHQDFGTLTGTGRDAQFLHHYRFDGGHADIVGRWNCRIDGGEELPDTGTPRFRRTTTGPIPSSITPASDQISIGIDPDGTTAPISMNMKEIVITGDITAEERQKMEGYILWTRGYQSRLPSGHPYEDKPPLREVF